MTKKANTEVAETTVAEATVAETTEATTKSEKMVTIELFKDNKDYKDDVFVCINGKNIVVKRGKEVEIPEAYAKVVKQSLQQDQKTALLMDKMQEEYQREAERN